MVSFDIILKVGSCELCFFSNSNYDPKTILKEESFKESRSERHFEHADPDVRNVRMNLAKKVS